MPQTTTIYSVHTTENESINSNVTDIYISQAMAPRPKQEDESEGKPTETLDGRYSEYLSIMCICINCVSSLF